MLLENKKIAIIGGGPGGLTLARLLQREGVDVTVYERDIHKDVRVQGATLDLHFESGLKAIAAAGLTDRFKEAYRPGADKGRVLDKDANILYDEHEKEAGRDFGDESFRPEIDRSDLRDLLLHALQPGTIVWNSQFLTMAAAGDGWRLTFKNGTTATADIVIGADGANSKIRPFVTPIKASYAGITILQGNVVNGATAVPAVHQLLKGGKLYIHSDGKFLHVSAKGDGSIDFYVSIKMEEKHTGDSGIDFTERTQLANWYNKTFAGWNRLWFQLFENSSLPLLVRPQYYVPLHQTWAAQSNISLLGDAAHIMPPSGEGVNLAMLDALELSECLTDNVYTNTRAAIAAYENQMRARAAVETKISLDGVEWMHSEEANEKLIRLFTEG